MGSLGQGTWILILSSVFDMSCAAVLSQSVVSDTFVTPWTVACQAPLSMGFSRHEYWSGLPFPTPGDLLNPGIKPMSLASPALAGEFFTTAPRGKFLIFAMPT